MMADSILVNIKYVKKLLLRKIIDNNTVIN